MPFLRWLVGKTAWVVLRGARGGAAKTDRPGKPAGATIWVGRYGRKRPPSPGCGTAAVPA